MLQCPTFLEASGLPRWCGRFLKGGEFSIGGTPGTSHDVGKLQMILTSFEKRVFFLNEATLIINNPQLPQ
jgi:hypothetical protein